MTVWQSLTARALRSGPIGRVVVIAALALATGIAVPAAARAQGGGPASLRGVAQPLLDAVVNISTSQTLKGPQGVQMPQVPPGSPFEDFFKDFFDGQKGGDGPRKVNSLGSGFVIDPKGLIVTNEHVIREADEIIINFANGEKLKVVEIVGRDTKTDLALLRVEPKKPLTAVAFGNSEDAQVGDWVMAIGNPFGLGGSVTVGIISAKKRDIQQGPFDEYLQTDAAINKGNSGGPLFNMDGQVIGVNTAIYSPNPTGGSVGVGFALPSNTASLVIDQLKAFGEPRRGWLGVAIQRVTDDIAASIGMPEPKGAMVGKLNEGGPAEKAGLKVGDIIVAFDGQDVANHRALPRLVANTPIDKAVPVAVLRRGANEQLETKTYQVTVGRLEEPSEKVQSAAIEPKKPEEAGPATRDVLGLTLSPLSDELRQRFSLQPETKGVVVTAIDPKSGASDREVAVGDIIVEVAGVKVETVAQVEARVEAIRKEKRPSVLVLLSDGKGDIRFVTVPF